MFCKYCGNEIAENTKFCTKCGKIIVNEAVQNKVHTLEPNEIIRPQKKTICNYWCISDYCLSTCGRGIWLFKNIVSRY